MTSQLNYATALAGGYMKGSIHFLIALVFLIIGCASTPIVCRHDVFPVGLVYVEKGYDVHVVEYQTSPYNNHAQIQVFDEHKWKWAVRIGDSVSLRNSPEFPIMGTERIYSLEEYFNIVYSKQRK